MKNKSLLVLVVILTIATVLRVYRLDSSPPSLFGDEVDVGYQAYSLLKTGQDLYGTSYPTLIHSLSEYRAPLFIYSDVPFIAIFGLNEWGVRLAAAFWGVLSIAGVFLLARKLFSEKIGLFSAGFLTISPWHLQYSRAGFEVTMLLSFFAFGTYFFLKGLEKKWLFIVSAIFFGLTPYIYSTAVVFAPSYLLVLGILYRHKILAVTSGKINWIPYLATLILLIVLVPYIFQTFAGNSGERFSLISIFGNQTIKDKVFLARQTEGLSLGSAVFHSVKLTELQNFSINYVRTFSPEFLLAQGDPNQRHSIGDMGELYFFEIALLIIGLLGLLKGLESDAGRKLVLAWIILAPIPAALTFDGGFHATRNFLILAPLTILEGHGANYILKSKWRFTKVAGVFLILVALFNFSFYLHRYYNDYPRDSWRAWHFGFKQAFQSEKSLDLQYGRIFINNSYEPALIRFLFWTQYDPSLFHKQFISDKTSKDVANGFDGFQFDKYYFGKFDGPFEDRLDTNTLWIASARDDITSPATLTDSRIKLLQTVYSPSGEPVFFLITGNEKK